MRNYHAPVKPADREYRVMVGGRLRSMRKMLGLKSAQMCDILGIARNTYSQWESGVNLPDVRAMVDLCDRFGVTLDYIYRGDKSGLPLRLAAAS
jgi:transcriptional regulator with XRE-family HTH domain